MHLELSVEIASCQTPRTLAAANPTIPNSHVCIDIASCQVRSILAAIDDQHAQMRAVHWPLQIIDAQAGLDTTARTTRAREARQMIRWRQCFGPRGRFDIAFRTQDNESLAWRYHIRQGDHVPNELPLLILPIHRRALQHERVASGGAKSGFQMPET